MSISNFTCRGWQTAPTSTGSAKRLKFIYVMFGIWRTHSFIEKELPRPPQTWKQVMVMARKRAGPRAVGSRSENRNGKLELIRNAVRRKRPDVGIEAAAR